MSGSTQLNIRSEFYKLFIESPCIKFSDPNREIEYHKEKNRLFQKQLKILKPIFDKFFNTLTDDNQSLIKLVKYNDDLPQIFEESLIKNPIKIKHPCRHRLFLFPNAPIAGLLHIDIAFYEIIGSNPMKTLKHNLEKLIKSAIRYE